MISKNEKQIEIHGEADWIYLNEPDNKYGDPGEFKVTLKVPRAKSGELIRDINEVISTELKTKYGPSGTERLSEARRPYTVKGDIVEFKLHSQFKPILWDKNQNKLDEEINVWKGSTMWASCKARGYSKSIGTGATLMMGSVQIDKLVEGKSLDSCPFPARNNGSTESVLPAAIDPPSYKKDTHLKPSEPNPKDTGIDGYKYEEDISEDYKHHQPKKRKVAL